MIEETALLLPAGITLARPQCMSQLFHFILHGSYYFSISITFSPRIFRYIGYGADGSKWFASEMKGSYILRVVIILIAPVFNF